MPDLPFPGAAEAPVLDASPMRGDDGCPAGRWVSTGVDIIITNVPWGTEEETLGILTAVTKDCTAASSSDARRSPSDGRAGRSSYRP